MAEAALVLALDTSTVVNVGLARGDRVLATATVADQMAHVEQLMPLVSECLDAAGAQVSDLEQVGRRSWSGAVHRAASWCGPPRRYSGHVLGPGAALASAASTSWPRSSAGRKCQRSSWLPPMPGDARCTGLAIVRTAYDSESRESSQPGDVPRLATIGPGSRSLPDQLEAVPGPRSMDPGCSCDAAVRRCPTSASEPLYLRHPDATELTRPKSVLHYQGVRR